MQDSTQHINSQIMFSCEPPREGAGILLHYEHEPVLVEGWTTHDVRKIISLYEDEWLLAIESWHRELSERATKLTQWWWLIPGSRLVLWESSIPFSLKPVLFALAVINLCEQQDKGVIWIVGAPDELIEYLNEWLRKDKTVQLDNEVKEIKINQHNKYVFKVTRFYLRIFKWAVFFFMRISFRRRKRIAPSSVIVNSAVLDSDLIDTIGDHFFGHMLDEIHGLPKENVAWLYNDLVIDKIKAKSKLTGIGRRAYFISDYFHWSDLWFALREGIKVKKVMQKLLINSPQLCIGKIKFSKFNSYFITNLVIDNIPVFDFIFYSQMRRIIAESGARVLIYPYEEKTIERAILMAARQQKHHIKTIGFAHAAYSKGHLYIRRDKKGEPPRPDYIAVTGEIGRKRFEDAGVPNQKIIVTGSPRYHTNVNDISHMNPKQRKKILFIVGLGFEMRIFAAMISKNPNILAKYDLRIRRSYHSWFDEQDKAEKRMQTAGVEYSCENGALVTQIDESDIVLYEATSAGLEAVLRGKLAIRLNLSDTISTKHFLDVSTEQHIKYCQNLEEFVLQLDNVFSLTFEQYTAIVQQQRELVEHLFSPIDKTAIGNLLSH
ncbi:MAG: hypothetical protein QM504_09490 [Pseudomonadota bacterium]